MVRKQRRFKTPSPKKLVGAFLLVICLLFVLFPLLLMAAASFMPEDELARRYLAVLELGREPVLPALVPDFSVFKTLCGFVSTLTRLLCYVLEFMPAGALRPGRTASGRHAGRLGICEI